MTIDRPYTFASRSLFEDFVQSNTVTLIIDREYLRSLDKNGFDFSAKNHDVSVLRNAVQSVCSRYDFTSMAFIGFSGQDMSQIVNEVYYDYTSNTNPNPVR
jgi:hypothetical protein